MKLPKRLVRPVAITAAIAGIGYVGYEILTPDSHRKHSLSEQDTSVINQNMLGVAGVVISGLKANSGTCDPATQPTCRQDDYSTQQGLLDLGICQMSDSCMAMDYVSKNGRSMRFSRLVGERLMRYSCNYTPPKHDGKDIFGEVTLSAEGSWAEDMSTTYQVLDLGDATGPCTLRGLDNLVDIAQTSPVVGFNIGPAVTSFLPREAGGVVIDADTHTIRSVNELPRDATVDFVQAAVDAGRFARYAYQNN